VSGGARRGKIALIETRLKPPRPGGFDHSPGAEPTPHLVLSHYVW
jgi:hypothetical protein